MSSIMRATSRALLVGLLILGVQTGARAQAALTADLQAEIEALISQAVAAGDAEILENGLFDMTEANDELAVAIADYASGHLPSTLPANLPADFMEALAVAAVIGPSLAAPSLASDIGSAVASNQPRFAGTLTSALESALADIEPASGEGEAAAGLEAFETAAGGPPAGLPPALPSFAAPAAVSATSENPSVVSASPTD